MPTHSAAQRVPKQARSVETVERLLDAAEALLEEKSFDDTSVAEIAARARMTIGALYARFPDKDAVLRLLEERMTADFVAVVDEDLRPQASSRRVTLERFILSHHRRLISTYARHRAVARALVLRSHTDPMLKRRLDQLNEKNMPRLAHVLLKSAKIKHPKPERAVAFALLAARSLCREVILFREGWSGYRSPSGEAFAEELTRMFFGCLGMTMRSR